MGAGLLTRARHARAAVPLAAAVLTFLLAVSPAWAAPGDLDVTFGAGGGVTLDVGDIDWGCDVVVQPDGRILVVGAVSPVASDETRSIVMARWLPNGAPDLGFGVGGVVTAQLGSSSGLDAVALRPDGRIVAVGWVADASSRRDLLIQRYTAAGALDTTFSGDGWVTTDLRGGGDDEAVDVLLQPTGEILVGGSAEGRFALVRYTADGQLDSGFATGGVALTELRADPHYWYDDHPGGISLQADGRIVAAAGLPEADGMDLGVVRYTAAGARDTTFGTGGMARTDIADREMFSKVAVQPDGRIVAAGTMLDVSAGRTRIVVARYTATGAPDPTFHGGWSSSDPSLSVMAYDMTLQPNGRVAVVGEAHGDIAILRWTGDGDLDASFATGGWRIADFGGRDEALAVALQADGKIVVTGTVNGDLGVFRHLGDDVTPPQTTIDSGPDGPTNDATPTFTFSANESGVRFSCRDPSGIFVFSCTSPYTTLEQEEGDHSFSVWATDAAGNTEPSPAVRSFTVDLTPPQTTIDGGPDALGNDRTPSFRFSASEDDATFRCSLDDGRSFPCTSPARVTVDDGPHTFTVRATDAAGNAGTPARYSFAVDTVAPDTTITSGPPETTHTATPSFAFAASDPGAHFECRVGNAAFAPCASPHTLDAQADGRHVFRVRAFDRAGNADPTPAEHAFTVDTTEPDTTITSGPSDPTSDAAPELVFTSGKAGVTFECRVDGGDFSACTSPWTTPALEDGSHEVEVRAVDAAGRVDPNPAWWGFTVDTSTWVELTAIVPPSPANDNTPRLKGTGEDGARVDIYTTGDCSGAPAASGTVEDLRTTGLAVAVGDDTTTTFRERATDALGNTSACPDLGPTYVEDSTDPDTTLDETPDQLSADSTPAFAFSSSEPGGTFECRMRPAAFAACSSLHVADPLPDGEHVFEVRAVDAAGNADESPATWTFTIDTRAPETTIVSGPGDVTGDPTPTFAFTADEAPAGFECLLDGGPWAACASPWTTPALQDGRHTVAVRAFDPPGNTEPEPATRTFTVDTAAPAPPVLAGTVPRSPADATTPRITGTAESAATIRLHDTPACTGEPVATGDAGQLAEPGIAVTVQDDTTTTFHATATDAAGNTSGCSAGLTYVEDSTAPDTRLDRTPDPVTTDAAPTFAFSATEAGAVFECRLDAAPFASCTSPLTVGPLALGDHAFAVRARDQAGNPDPTPAGAAFTIRASQTPGQTTPADPRAHVERSAGPLADTGVELVVTARRRQRLRRAVALKAGCAGEACTVTASGRVRVGSGRRAKRLTLRARRRVVPAGRAATITLRLSKKARRTVARALARRRPVRATVTVKAVDAARNTDTVRVTLTLRR